MFDKLTDNMKFFLMLIVYVIYLTWWAATINATVVQQGITVEQQSIINAKTIVLLDAHIEECRQKELEKAHKDYILNNLQDDIDEIKDDIDGLKKGK